MTKRFVLSTGFATICVLSNTALATETENLSLPEIEAVREILQQHCVQCHGGDDTNAGVNLAELNTELDVWQNRAVWARAQLMIDGGKMPPEEGRPLADDQRDSLARWIQHTLDNVDVERIPRDPGFVPPRRLTGREYNYTVQDLFGLDGPVYEFPDDLVIGDSFENSADTLNFDALWLEKALAAADATVRAVWADPVALDRLVVLRPSPPPIDDDAVFVADREISKRCDTGGDFSIVAKVVGFPERVFLRSLPGIDRMAGSKELGFDDESLEYRISRRRTLRAADLGLGDDKPHWIGLTVREGRASLYLDGRLLVSRARFERPDMPGHVLKIGVKEEQEEEKEDETPSEDEGDRIETFLFYAGPLPDKVMLALDQNSEEAELPAATFRWIAGMETPPAADFVTAEQATEVVMGEFLARAFRRDPSRETLDRYTGLLKDGLDEGLTFELALQHPVATALSSPAFLLLSDSHSEAAGAHPLSAVDLSNRLSYFLWSSLPDDELRNAANRGLLTDPEELIRQTDRLLADPKADRFYSSFVLQWLRTEGLGDTIRPSAERFPEVTDSLLASMRREGPLYFADAVKNDHPLLYLIESPYSLVNGELAEHYGFEGIGGTTWRRVEHADSRRGGVLTQAAVLTVSSSPQRTSPVFRGKWVLEVLLGDPPPPPPANVPPLPAADSDSASSLRESLELHRRQEACAGCHSRIDPYGLALEQYDAVGGLRSKPQDTRTTLHTGELLKGAGDLKQHLGTKRKDDFLRHLTRKMLAYALGRELQFSDERAVHEILVILKKNNLGARALIHQVVLSEPFRLRRIPSREDDAATTGRKDLKEG